MTYGKNQQALLKFLQKHPNRWHRIKRRKAIDAAKGLEKRGDCRIHPLAKIIVSNGILVSFKLPQMLREQA